MVLDDKPPEDIGDGSCAAICTGCLGRSSCFFFYGRGRHRCGRHQLRGSIRRRERGEVYRARRDIRTANCLGMDLLNFLDAGP